MELHIFDFDGTLFNSPAPREAQVRAEHGAHMVGRLTQPMESGGLGWFQSLATLCPPTVPECPDEGRWFVTPVVERLRALCRDNDNNGKENPNHTVASTADDGGDDEEGIHRDGTGHNTASSGNVNNSNTTTNGSVACYVLTGRDEKYRARIEALLAQAGLLPLLSGVFLKPTETAGTVKYKLGTFLALVRQHSPSRVVYYEDRPEQGGKLYAGIRALQDAYYNPASNPTCPSSSQQRPVGGPVVAWTGPGSLCSLEYITDNTTSASGSSGGSGSAASPTSASASPHPLSFNNLFGGNSHGHGVASAAVRTGRRWAAESIDADNEAETQRRDVGGYEAPVRRRTRIDHSSSSNNGYGYGGKGNRGSEEVPIESVEFPAPPLFHFTMVMVPARLAVLSEQMLTDEEQRRLIQTLLAERASYEAGNDPHPQFRGNTNTNSRGGGGGGGGGTGRGRGGRGGGGACRGGRGRGGGASWHAQQQQQQPPPENTSWPAKAEYPTLPPA